MNMNPVDCCRTCLNNKEELQDINSIIRISQNDVCLRDILHLFYGYDVSMEDGLPSKICINCVYQLTITQSFKYLIESSYKKLIEKYKCYDHEQDFDNPDAEFESCEEIDTIYTDPKHYKISTKTKMKESCLRESLFCVDCKKQFFSRIKLLKHCRAKHETKCKVGRECQYCEEKFEDLQSLIIHNKLHLKPYLCLTCWKGYLTSKELNTHSCIRNIDDGEKTNSENEKTNSELRQCDQCGRKYAASYISSHMKTHSEERTYKCKLCPKRFKVRNGLHSHVQWTHKRTRNHVCDICNATFISSGSRSMHIRKTHLNERKYCCECGKRFFSKSELDRHTLTHTGAKNFHCNFCDKSYQTRYGLNVHLRSHAIIPTNNI